MQIKFFQGYIAAITSRTSIIYVRMNPHVWPKNVSLMDNTHEFQRIPNLINIMNTKGNLYIQEISIYIMKKRKKASKKRISRKRFWTGLIIIALLIGAVMTAVQTSFYGLAVGVFIGYLVSHLMENL